jgi:hypothetical protein
VSLRQKKKKKKEEEEEEARMLMSHPKPLCRDVVHAFWIVVLKKCLATQGKRTKPAMVRVRIWQAKRAVTSLDAAFEIPPHQPQGWDPEEEGSADLGCSGCDWAHNQVERMGCGVLTDRQPVEGFMLGQISGQIAPGGRNADIDTKTAAIFTS